MAVERIWVAQTKYGHNDDWVTWWRYSSEYRDICVDRLARDSHSSAHDMIIGSASQLGFPGWQEMAESKQEFRRMIFREMKRRGAWRVKRVEVRL